MKEENLGQQDFSIFVRIPPRDRDDTCKNKIPASEIRKFRTSRQGGDPWSKISKIFFFQTCLDSPKSARNEKKLFFPSSRPQHFCTSINGGAQGERGTESTEWNPLGFCTSAERLTRENGERNQRNGIPLNFVPHGIYGTEYTSKKRGGGDSKKINLQDSVRTCRGRSKFL